MSLFSKDLSIRKETTIDDSIRNFGLSVKDFGAKGNGITPDDKAFQDTINAVSRAGGGLVRIPATASGYYLSYANQINLASNVYLDCSDGPRIFVKSLSNTSPLAGSGIFYFNGVTNSGIIGTLKISSQNDQTRANGRVGLSSNSSAVYINNSNNLHFDCLDVGNFDFAFVAYQQACNNITIDSIMANEVITTLYIKHVTNFTIRFLSSYKTMIDDSQLDHHVYIDDFCDQVHMGHIYGYGGLSYGFQIDSNTAPYTRGHIDSIIMENVGRGLVLQGFKGIIDKVSITMTMPNTDPNWGANYAITMYNDSECTINSLYFAGLCNVLFRATGNSNSKFIVNGGEIVGDVQADVVRLISGGSYHFNNLKFYNISKQGTTIEGGSGQNYDELVFSNCDFYLTGANIFSSIIKIYAGKNTFRNCRFQLLNTTTSLLVDGFGGEINLIDCVTYGITGYQNTGADKLATVNIINCFNNYDTSITKGISQVEIKQALVPVNTLPTPSAMYRGTSMTLQGRTGVADQIYTCIKQSDDTYSWVLMTTQNATLLQSSSGVTYKLGITDAGVITPTTTASLLDLFDRTDSSTTLGNATSGQTWSTLQGTFGIIGNEAYCVTDTSSDLAKIPNPLNDNYAITCDMKGALESLTDTRRPGIVFQYIDGNNFFVSRLDHGRVYLVKRDAGTETTLVQSGVVALNDNTYYRLKTVYKSGNVTVYLAGIPVITYTLTSTELAKFANAPVTGIRLTKTGSPSVVAKWNNFIIESV